MGTSSDYIGSVRVEPGLLGVIIILTLLPRRKSLSVAELKSREPRRVLSV